MIRRKWSDKSSYDDAKSWIWIVRLWCCVTRVNLDLWATKRVCCLLLLPIGSIHGDDPRSVADSVRGWTVLFRCPAAFRLPKLTTGVLLRVLLQRSAQSELVRRRQSVRQLVGNVDRQGTSACFRLCSLSLVHDAPCGLRSCKNRPAPFPGRMSYKATRSVSWPAVLQGD